MYKISKEELRKYLLEKFSDESLLEKLDEYIEQALKELKLSEITAQNIDEICSYIVNKNHKIIVQNANKNCNYVMSQN